MGLGLEIGISAEWKKLLGGKWWRHVRRGERSVHNCQIQLGTNNLWLYYHQRLILFLIILLVWYYLNLWIRILRLRFFLLNFHNKIFRYRTLRTTWHDNIRSHICIFTARERCRLMVNTETTPFALTVGSQSSSSHK